jgi:hypothetical protein
VQRVADARGLAGITVNLHLAMHRTRGRTDPGSPHGVPILIQPVYPGAAQKMSPGSPAPPAGGAGLSGETLEFG